MILHKYISVFSLICLVVLSNFESESMNGMYNAPDVSSRYSVEKFIFVVCPIGCCMFLYEALTNDLISHNVMLFLAFITAFFAMEGWKLGIYRYDMRGQ